jgi:cellulose synthase/poly-beta-1,6-N-acetylglucosamine synthase-like glycosyltransferase
MAYLRMKGLWERLLMPAFIYFFKLLYPFALSNSRSRIVAAAAGGCILMRTDVLSEIGGFGTIRTALIDDCSLARSVKNRGYRTWTGLTRSVISHREYSALSDVWAMVARTAYAQLHHSIVLLLVCSALMVAAFVLPLAALFQPAMSALVVGIASLLLMAATYAPTIRYYGLGMLWVLTLPIAGLLFLLMTWSSAASHWFGRGAAWKDRHYLRPTGP